ncbi:carboxymuconolactone decarboxylase family protein [Nocardia seriolae]|uniref:Carboxymuconolactone decarboxylase-like domain-containing protein n=1 Tax=Nocardia seriolae TaxID=37332 RepID=A0A0B8NIG5_9NOCA|nr:carboxymuconolactone decarboxylase family protein [Nocardia seriolae]MTJ61858.1 carboxymuconolactone decarboxylase family protein [Nocardia seriolae]MTJ74605.1 carboxymuconolactone decarboxylase family protein [Nocardia seriolae]MTJ90106.1 carboxymuconolactone decarboxylase family protein [Nocardia seriolae]MTK34072.1 carboxymuconolactone decarboxylase family protein [Nocardia seriolae]MTK39805.1 carboxymuconolactone decarboxylase family protein [Nocardia seriolae]
MITPVEHAPLLDEVRKRMGRVPNMTKVMANAPVVLEGYLGLSGALKKGTLPVGTAERIALTVGAANDCGYCVAAHTFTGKRVAKLGDAEVEAAKLGTSADPKEAAAVAFARELTESRGKADPAAALAAGWTQEQVLEIVALVALQTLTNYVNKVGETENDWPAA